MEQTDKNESYPLQLLDVRLYSLRVQRHQSSRSAGADEDEREALPLAIDTTVEWHSEHSVSVWLAIEVRGPYSDHPEYEMELELEGLFQSSVNKEELDPETLHQFEEVSSLVSLWPYAREQFHDLSFRMRVDLPVLPTLSHTSMVSLASQVAAIHTRESEAARPT